MVTFDSTHRPNLPEPNHTHQESTMKSHLLKPLLQASAIGLAASLCVSLAYAHPSFETKSAAIGASYKAVLRIPHGCEGSPTTRVDARCSTQGCRRAVDRVRREIQPRLFNPGLESGQR